MAWGKCVGPLLLAAISGASGSAFAQEAALSAAAPQSTCFGTVRNGRIENAVSLPREGPNFVRMAQGPISAGRV